MNCIHHPEIPVAAYCQNCGKPLCNECTRPVAGFIYCEQCLAAKVGAPVSGSFREAVFPPGTPLAASGPNPALATLLGFIPGVGAMYNGQFVKAMIHVLVFVILIAITDQHDFFGFFIAAWVLYQVFDANQTAKARRDGLPLPDPFGINELANRIGNQYPGIVPPGGTPGPIPGAAAGPIPGPIPGPFPGAAPGVPPYPPPPASSFVGGAYPPYAPPGAAYAPPPPGANYPPPPVPEMPPPPFPDVARRNEPAGAIVLIVLGMLFLFGTLGIFSFHWISRGWPLIIIAIGVWLFYKQTRKALPPGGGQ
jgi:TM2 domain-containing membrane protein YozV